MRHSKSRTEKCERLKKDSQSDRKGENPKKLKFEAKPVDDGGGDGKHERNLSMVWKVEKTVFGWAGFYFMDDDWITGTDLFDKETDAVDAMLERGFLPEKELFRIPS